MATKKLFRSRGEMLVHLANSKNKNITVSNKNSDVYSFDPENPFNVSMDENLDDSDKDPDWLPSESEQNVGDSDICNLSAILDPDLLEKTMNTDELVSIINNDEFEEDILNSTEPIDSEKQPQVLEESSANRIYPVDAIAIITNPQAISSEDKENYNSNDVALKPMEVVDEVPGKKRRKADETNWKWNVIKNRRMHGISYTRKQKDTNGEHLIAKERELKHRGCKTRCSEKKYGRSCWSFSEQERREIFEKFWSLDWSEKKAYVVSMIDQKDVKERRVPEEESRRKCSLSYFLNCRGSRKEVCKSMFLNTLSVGEKSVYNWLAKSKHGMSGNQAPQALKVKSSKISQSSEKVLSVREYLNNLPKVPSHYCRASSAKQYLEPIFDSFSHLYRIYKKWCNENGQTSASKTLFTTEYQSLNLAIYKPKKDLCDICCSFEAGNLDVSAHNTHIANKDMARTEKECDKRRAILDPTIKVLTVDLQAVLLAPCLNASAMYYKTKLSCHNYTVYDLASKECTCFFWHEGEGELTANSFASCICSYIKTILDKSPSISEVIIFSDGCTYQNRNVILANALLKLAMDNNITIYQKFLEKGHTQMECDSVHSAVERKLRGKQIHSPYDYLDAIRAARADPQPYQVQYLTHSFFNDYSKLKLYSSIRPGVKVGDPVVTNIRVLKYSPNNTIQFKLSFSDPFEDLPRRSRNTSDDVTVSITKLYSERLNITASKFKHLQELKLVLPMICHHFYDSLPHD